MTVLLNPIQEARPATKAQRKAARNQAVEDYGEPEAPSRGGSGTDSVARKNIKVVNEDVGILEGRLRALEEVYTPMRTELDAVGKTLQEHHLLLAPEE